MQKNDLHAARQHALHATDKIEQVQMETREIKHYSQLLQIARKTLLDAHYILFSLLYLVLLASETLISAPMIKNLTQETMQLQGAFWTAVFYVFYFSLLTAVTLISSEYISMAKSNRHRQFFIQIRKLAQPQAGDAALTYQYDTEAAKKYQLGIVWMVFLCLVITLLCISRIYIVNERLWRFRVLDLIQFLPLGLAILLVTLGKYKLIWVKKIMWEHKMKSAIKRVKKLRIDIDRQISLMLEQLPDAVDRGNLPVEIQVGLRYYYERNPFEIADNTHQLIH